jgi:hypothetical protein
VKDKSRALALEDAAFFFYAPEHQQATLFLRTAMSLSSSNFRRILRASCKQSNG